VDERVKDMNANGVLGSLNFPSMARFCGQFFASRASQDPDLALAVLHAYNDWHIDAWCGAYPERFIPCTIPPIWDPQLMAAEIHRTAAKGSHCVSFSMNPHALGLPSLHSDHWDPFWAACDETDTVVTLHIGSGGLEVQTSPDAPMNVRITCSGINIYPTAADLVWSPVFQKFKNVKIALAEGGVGWIPYFLERIDYTYEHHKAWTRPDLGGQLPSEIFRERIITCFIVDKFGLGNLDAMNEDMVAWECDYPHSDTTWPRSPEVVWDSVQGLSDEQINKITHANAMRLFSFDPFATRPRARCTVGALREEAAGRDVSNVSHGMKEHKVMTLGQFVGAAKR
jgi:predicted TIM-barrel fold metal-dependent hydrolase